MYAYAPSFPISTYPLGSDPNPEFEMGWEKEEGQAFIAHAG